MGSKKRKAAGESEKDVWHSPLASPSGHNGRSVAHEGSGAQQPATAAGWRAGGGGGGARSGGGGSAAAAEPRQQPGQQGANRTVRVEMTILPSPPQRRTPTRGKRLPAPALAPPPAAAAARQAPAAAAAAAAAAGLTHRPAAHAAVPATAAAPAAAAPRAPASAAPRGAAPAPAPAAAPPAAGEQQPRKKQRKHRKTLSAKGKKAAVLGVLADVELSRAAAAAAAAAADGGAVQQLQQQQQQQQPPAPAAAPAVVAGPRAGMAAPVGQQQAAAADPAATANLGKAWSKADIAKLARLGEERAFLLQAIPQHPPEGDLDWELISRHFGRYSRGGLAVRQQYYAVQRLKKEVRHEGKRGVSYVDLVARALQSLPDRRGTVLEVQAVLKRDYAPCLDKYRGRDGALRWKKAVGEVLREQPDLFEQRGKSGTGKIIWALRQPAAAGAAAAAAPGGA